MANNTILSSALIAAPVPFNNCDVPSRIAPLPANFEISHPESACTQCGCTCRYPLFDPSSYHVLNDPSLSLDLDLDDPLFPLTNPIIDHIWLSKVFQPPSSPLDNDSNTPLFTVAVPQLDIVPQRLYRPRGKTQGFSAGQISIPFQTSDGDPFPVRKALDADYVHLSGRDDSMTPIQQSASIYIRIEWPGYPSHKQNVRTMTWTKTPKAIARSKLATKIAKSLNDFVMDAYEHYPDVEVGSWTVGPRGSDHIAIDNLALVSLDKVSKSSWQPVFCRI